MTTGVRELTMGTFEFFNCCIEAIIITDARDATADAFLDADMRDACALNLAPLFVYVPSENVGTGGRSSYSL